MLRLNLLASGNFRKNSISFPNSVRLANVYMRQCAPKACCYTCLLIWKRRMIVGCYNPPQFPTQQQQQRQDLNNLLLYDPIHRNIFLYIVFYDVMELYQPCFPFTYRAVIFRPIRRTGKNLFSTLLHQYTSNMNEYLWNEWIEGNTAVRWPKIHMHTAQCILFLLFCRKQTHMIGVEISTDGWVRPSNRQFTYTQISSIHNFGRFDMHE